MIILYENKILTSTITGNSENVNFPLTNLKLVDSTKYCRSIVDTGVRIVFNLASLKADWFFILNHNITSGATIKIEANTSDSWGSPAFSETITWNADTIWHGFTEQTYDYWSLYVDDSSNPNDFIQIGLLSLGKGLVMPGFDPAVKVSYVDTTNRTRSPELITYKDIRPVYRVVSVKFTTVTQTEFKAVTDCIKTMLDFYHDTGDPVIVVPYQETIDVEPPVYAEMPSRIEKEKLPVNGVLFTISLELEETF